MAKRAVRVSVGILVVLISLAGVAHSVRGATAHVLFFQARYGHTMDNTVSVLQRCERAYRFYPWNYHFCLLAANKSFSAALKESEDVPEATAMFPESQKWCERGIQINSYSTGLRFRKMGLLAAKEDARQQAIEFWERHTNWEFWNPDNHYYLAVMYALTGNIEKAGKALYWSRGSRYYAIARKIIDEAKSVEVAE